MDVYRLKCRMNPLAEEMKRSWCKNQIQNACPQSEEIIQETSTVQCQDIQMQQAPKTTICFRIRSEGNGVGCGSILFLMGNGYGTSRISGDGKGWGDGDQRGGHDGTGSGRGILLGAPNGGNGPFQNLFFP